MRVPAITFALTLFAALPATAATISPTEANTHVGQAVTVEGIVSNVHAARTGAVTFIDIGGSYPNNAFTAVIFAPDMNKFPNIGSYIGKKADITGTIKDYKGKPEIVLTAADQLQLAP